jgi:Zn-dependent peptidase ImmA (M78 family)
MMSFLGKQHGAQIDLPRSVSGEEAELAAGRIREWLGVALDEQVSWGSGVEAWKNWREQLEQLGLLVFVLQLGPDNIRGFSSWDSVAPVIAVNTAYNPEARIFTAFHELGHLTLRSEAACADLAWTERRPAASDIAEERWCEEFAASALLPRLAVLEFADATAPSTQSGFDLAVEVASKFNVSIRAAAIRLIRLDIEDETLYALVNERARVWDRNKGFARGRPAGRVQRRLNEYGTAAMSKLISGSNQGLLNLRDLRDFLRVDATEVDEISDLLDVGG